MTADAPRVHASASPPFSLSLCGARKGHIAGGRDARGSQDPFAAAALAVAEKNGGGVRAAEAHALANIVYLPPIARFLRSHVVFECTCFVL